MSEATIAPRVVPVMELEGVALRKMKDPFSLVIKSGELVFFECDREDVIPDLWSVFLGVDDPEIGSVHFDGVNWREMEDAQLEANRLSSGCVYTGSGKYESTWLDNLDIDENVVLAQSMNPAYTQAELDTRLGELLKYFGLNELPGRRPVKVSAKESMRAQWVRAFLPKSLKLLILEKPTLGMPMNAVRKLIEKVSEVRETGTAVLWIDVRREEEEMSAISPSMYFDELPVGLR